MVYLGQQDAKLPWVPNDIVRRDQVRDYPRSSCPRSARVWNDTAELAARQAIGSARLDRA
jgi:hypothetical protein